MAQGPGLSAREAATRLQRDYPNELRSAPRFAACRHLLAFVDPPIYLLLGVIAIALVSRPVKGGVGWPVDAIVVATIMLHTGALDYVQEARTQDAVAALARMTAVGSTALRVGQVRRVPAMTVTRMFPCVAPAAATPTIRLAVDTIPSFAPSTAARSQLMRSLRWCSCSVRWRGMARA